MPVPGNAVKPSLEARRQNPCCRHPRPGHPNAGFAKGKLSGRRDAYPALNNLLKLGRVRIAYHGKDKTIKSCCPAGHAYRALNNLTKWNKVVWVRVSAPGNAGKPSLEAWRQHPCCRQSRTGYPNCWLCLYFTRPRLRFSSVCFWPIAALLKQLHRLTMRLFQRLALSQNLGKYSETLTISPSPSGRRLG